MSYHGACPCNIFVVFSAFLMVVVLTLSLWVSTCQKIIGYWREQIYIHAFFTSALDSVKLSDSHSGHLITEEGNSCMHRPVWLLWWGREKSSPKTEQSCTRTKRDIWYSMLTLSADWTITAQWNKTRVFTFGISLSRQAKIPFGRIFSKILKSLSLINRVIGNVFQNHMWKFPSSL